MHRRDEINRAMRAQPRTFVIITSTGDGQQITGPYESSHDAEDIASRVLGLHPGMYLVTPMTVGPRSLLDR